MRTVTLGILVLSSATVALAGLPVVPEPSSVLLLAGGLGALILLARKGRKN